MRAKYEGLYKRLGYNIAYYRKKKNYTQFALAEKIGIEQTHMCKIEVARVGISLDVLFDLAKALEVEPYQFLRYIGFGDPPETPSSEP